MTGVARWPVGSAARQRRAHSVQVATGEAEHHRRSGVVLARIGAVASPMARASREKTASALATVITAITARVSRRRPVSSRVTPVTRRPRPSSRRPAALAAGAGEVAQQQPGEQGQERGTSQGEGPREASGDEGEHAGPHAGDQEGVKRTERPPPRRDPPAPHQAVQRLPSDA